MKEEGSMDAFRIEHIDMAVSEYLKRQTNYALLITGKWGSGKTHYYKNSLVPLMENIETRNDARKKYKPIHISLFGLSSVEEIQTQIFLSIAPILKKGAVKISLNVLKTLGRGALSLYGLGKIDDYVGDIPKCTKDLISFERLVICFDDFERMSPKINVSEVIGFINTLVENNDAKVILITNKDNIDKYVYTTIREKTIGVVLDFSPDIRSITNIIIHKRYRGSQVYYSFLDINKILLFDLIGHFENNLRSILYVLDNLQTVYLRIAAEIAYKDKILNSEEIVVNLIRFVMSISNEYKTGRIAYENKNDIDVDDPENLRMIERLLLQKEGLLPDDPKVGAKGFHEKYYGKEEQFYFYPSLYKYLTGAGTLNITELAAEIERIFYVNENELSPEYEILVALRRDAFIEDDKEYKQNTKLMVEYAEKGKYSQLSDYLVVFRNAIRYGNLLQYNVEELCIRIEAGINKALPILKHEPGIGFMLHIEETEHVYQNEIRRLRDFITVVNRDLLEKQGNRDLSSIATLIEEDWGSFWQGLVNERKWDGVPVFKAASSYNISIKVSKMDLEELFGLYQVIKHRGDIAPISVIEEELPFFKELLRKLEPTSKTRQRKTRKNYVLDLVCEAIKELISKVTPVEPITENSGA